MNQNELLKQSVLHDICRQRLRYITVLPSLITLLNGVCGFAAIFFASKHSQADFAGITFRDHQFPFLTGSCYMIAVAMICDMLDGRVARMAKSTSSFGGQLDSLCDIISFGVAPAFMFIRLLEHRLSEVLNAGEYISTFIERFIWLLAAIYVCCGAIRLARFNVENEQGEVSHMVFYGLPIPAAAAVIGSLILLNQELLANIHYSHTAMFKIAHVGTLIALPPIVLAVSLLMISRMVYPHIVNQYLRGKKPFAYFVATVSFVLFAVFIFELAVTFFSLLFASTGPFNAIIAAIKRRQIAGQTSRIPNISIAK